MPANPVCIDINSRIDNTSETYKRSKIINASFDYDDTLSFNSINDLDDDMNEDRVSLFENHECENSYTP